MSRPEQHCPCCPHAECHQAPKSLRERLAGNVQPPIRLGERVPVEREEISFR
jgi:hypothetical protein